MANHYTFGIGQPHTEVEDALPPVAYDESTQSLVSGDRTFPVLNATAKLGSNYAAVVLPLNQSAGNPTDYSGNSVAVTIGASNTEAEAWANAGFFTSKAIVGSAGAIIPNSSIGVDLAVDSFIRAFTVARPITADTFAGCSDGTIPGVNVIMNGSGLIGPRLYVAAGVNFSALYGTAVVGGAALGATTNAAGYAVGATTITLASAGTGAITAADLIRFGTDPNLYTVSTGDADVSGGGTVVIPSPGLLKAIPASATPINVVAGTRVRRVMLAWDAPTKTMYQYVDGVLDFAYVATQTFAASEIETGAFNLGRSATGSTFGAKFAGFAQLTFPDAGLPKNTSEIAVQDNLLRRTGPANIAVFI